MRRTLIVAAAAIVAAVSCTRPVRQAPLIGISTGWSSSSSMSVSNSYVWSVENAGGIPVLLPLLRDSAMCEALLSKLDGVILTGGEDVDPLRYGQDTLPECGSINGKRDTSDLMIARCAVRNDIPLLAICRGEQVTNVALGGTLYQDIPSQVGDRVRHSQRARRDTATHMAGILPGTHLSSILGGIDSLGVNTFHHQAVLDVAPGLKVTAYAADGVVEAYEGFPELDVMAVQFHPEAFAMQGIEPYLSIFKDFISRAADKHHSQR